MIGRLAVSMLLLLIKCRTTWKNVLSVSFLFSGVSVVGCNAY